MNVRWVSAFVAIVAFLLGVRFWKPSEADGSAAIRNTPPTKILGSKIHWIDQVRYLAIPEISKSLNLQVTSNTQKKVVAKKGGATVTLLAGKDYLTYQNSNLFLRHPIKNDKGEILLSYDDYFEILVPLLALNLVEKKTTIPKTITIDPGHGGKDAGASNTRLNLKEKDVTLSVAQKLKAELIKKGYNVKLTREKDEQKELKDRPLIAKGSDLFISIHANSASSNQASGTEVYTLKRGSSFLGNAQDSWNLIAGYSILSALDTSAELINRGVKMAEFAVLKSLNCPGVLIELGFINNDTEAKKLADPQFQNKFVQGIIAGIEKYKSIVTEHK